ncbi:hypothetical protein LSAT2_030734 [Lamellibrachia satsuma]|nr:hypothetical protein LSAT2_030734 [Lamellibrachia satsuma]
MVKAADYINMTYVVQPLSPFNEANVTLQPTPPSDDAVNSGLRWGALMLTLIIIASIIGNVLVCLAVCWEKRLHNMTNFFLMSLAIADLLVSVLVMPFAMVVELYGYFPLDPAVCVVWATVDVMMCTASIWHMCTMSMDRYFTLKYPMKYGRNKTKAMVILKITFVWVVSTAISCPVLAYGFADYRNVYNEGRCAPGIRNFVIYGSVFAFYVPLLTMLVTYCLTIRIVRGSRSMMLRYVNGTCQKDNMTPINRNVVKKEKSAQDKRSEHGRPNKVKCRPLPATGVIYKRCEDIAVVTNTRQDDAMSTLPVVMAVTDEGDNDLRSHTCVCNSRQGSLKQNLLNIDATCGRMRSFLSNSQPVLPSMSPQRRLSAAAAPSIVNTRLVSSYLNVRDLESADNCDDVSCVTSLNSVLSRFGDITETDGSVTWSDIDQPHMLEKLSLIENEMDECLICEPPGAAPRETSGGCELGDNVTLSMKQADKVSRVILVPLASDIDSTLPGSIHSPMSHDTKTTCPGSGATSERCRVPNCSISSNCEPACSLPRGTVVSVYSNEMPSVARPSPMETSVLSQDSDVTDHASSSQQRQISSLDNVSNNTVERVHSGIMPTETECSSRMYFEFQLERRTYPPSPVPPFKDVPSRESHREAAEAKISTNKIINPTLGMTTGCLPLNKNSLSTRSMAEETLENSAGKVLNSRSYNRTNTYGQKAPINHPTMSDLPLSRTDSTNASRTDRANTITESNCPSKSNSDQSNTSTNICYATEHSRIAAPLCGENRFRRFLRRERAPHWRTLRFVQRKQHKKKAAKGGLVQISKRMLTNERKASKVLGIIVGVFLVLWTPFFVMNVLSVVCPHCVVAMTDSVSSSIVWLGYLSSLANPIIYTMFNTAFRQAFYRILTCQYRRQSAFYYNKTAESIYLSNSTKQHSEHRAVSRNGVV